MRSARQKIQELQRELEEERRNRKEMEKWIEENIGFGLEKISTLIDAAVTHISYCRAIAVEAKLPCVLVIRESGTNGLL